MQAPPEKPRHTAITKILTEAHESDRGCVIFCASLIEAQLESLLRSRLRKDRAASKVVESLFRIYAPFSTFSAKIQVAYALGIIPDRMHKQLLMVKKLRNDFAHDNGAVSFESAKYQPQIEVIRESFRGGTDDVEVNYLPKFEQFGEHLANRVVFCMCMSSICELLEVAEELGSLGLPDAIIRSSLDSTLKPQSTPPEHNDPTTKGRKSQ
jgi:DNA-binding MltR family transcriptional regulator